MPVNPSCRHPIFSVFLSGVSPSCAFVQQLLLTLLAAIVALSSSPWMCRFLVWRNTRSDVLGHDIFRQICTVIGCKLDWNDFMGWAHSSVELRRFMPRKCATFPVVYEANGQKQNSCSFFTKVPIYVKLSGFPFCASLCQFSAAIPQTSDSRYYPGLALARVLCPTLSNPVLRKGHCDI